MTIDLLERKGKGRPLVLIAQKGRYPEWRQKISSDLIDNFEVFEFEMEAEDSDNLAGLCRQFADQILSGKIRHFVCVSFGTSCFLPAKMAAFGESQMRSAILIDPDLEPAQRAGLYISSFLHRVRCPVLLLATSDRGGSKKQIAELEKKLPISTNKGVMPSVDELARAVAAFMDVPAKCPQRRGK